MSPSKRKSPTSNEKFSRRDHDKFRALMAHLQNMVDPALHDFGTDKALEFFAGIGAKVKPFIGGDGRPLRWQNELIINQIPARSTVLDLGCGDGELLKKLIDQKGVKGQGVELDPAAAIACIKRGVAVFQSDILVALRELPDHGYDYVILEETLQTLHYPDLVMLEMLRVGKIGIISFPNFAFWQVRLDFAIRGQMPRTGWLPHTWFNTPNIHNLTIQDFLDWAETRGVKIREGYVLARGKIRPLAAGDNLYAEEAILLVEKLSRKKNARLSPEKSAHSDGDKKTLPKESP